MSNLNADFVEFIESLEIKASKLVTQQIKKEHQELINTLDGYVISHQDQNKAKELLALIMTNHPKALMHDDNIQSAESMLEKIELIAAPRLKR